MFRVLPAVVALVGGLSVSPGATARVAQRPISSDKASLTPAQRKIDSQLRIEIERLHTKSPAIKTGVRLHKKGRAYVDIRADVTPAFQKQLKALGSTIASSSAEYRSIIAWVPLKKLEQVAASPSVHTTIPTPEPGIRK